MRASPLAKPFPLMIDSVILTLAAMQTPTTIVFEHSPRTGEGLGTGMYPDVTTKVMLSNKGGMAGGGGFVSGGLSDRS
jgi:hypothetical protein